MVRETTLYAGRFHLPAVRAARPDVRQEIPTMPGQYRLSIDQLAEEAREIAALGIPAVLLFGIPAHKDPVGLENFAATASCSRRSAPSKRPFLS